MISEENIRLIVTINKKTYDRLLHLVTFFNVQMPGEEVLSKSEVIDKIINDLGDLLGVK